MKSSPVPTICGVALAAMTTAGLSHWWSVRQFVSAFGSNLPVAVIAAQQQQSIPAATPRAKDVEKSPAPLAANPVKPAKAAPAPDARQKEFYEALISKINSLQNQNENLLDQLAETNRNVMNLEFRVDTHSESFRPLPVNEERQDASIEDGPGVLPPRAEPVLPTHE